MKLSLSFILCCVFFLGCQSFNKNKSGRSYSGQNTTRSAQQKSKLKADQKWLSKESIYQELTGQKINSQQAGQKLIKMAEQAQAEKNYILALKRYNAVIARFPKSQLAQTAYFGKTELYKKMGLSQQAQYNLRLAREFKTTTNQKQLTQRPAAMKKAISVRKTASQQKTGIKK